MCIWLGWQLFARQSGKREIVFALRKIYFSNPIEILYSTCAFMRYWVGLYLEITKKMIEAGVNMMMKTAF
jgi:hypothetical protein